MIFVTKRNMDTLIDLILVLTVPRVSDLCDCGEATSIIQSCPQSWIDEVMSLLLESRGKRWCLFLLFFRNQMMSWLSFCSLSIKSSFFYFPLNESNVALRKIRIRPGILHPNNVRFVHVRSTRALDRPTTRTTKCRWQPHLVIPFLLTVNADSSCVFVCWHLL